MDPESSPVADNLVIRVRGTFIDIGADASVREKRSSSAPPRRAVCFDEESEASHDSEYTAEWIERAKHLYLSASQSNTHHDTTDGAGPNASSNEGTVPNYFNASSNEATVPNYFNIPGSGETYCQSAASGADFLSAVYDLETEPYATEAQPIWAGSATLTQSNPVEEDSAMVGAGRCLCAHAITEGWCLCEDAHRLGLLPRGCEACPERSRSTMASRNDWQEARPNFDSSHSWDYADLAPEAPPIAASKFGLEDSGPYKRLNLARSGPDKNVNTRWLEENILSKHPLPETSAEPAITTLMLCDIPCRQTVEQIIDAILAHGFANTFNLVYMPSKRPKYLQNLGYAFVNFKTADYALAFLKDFQNYRFPSSKSQKLAYSQPARHQGYVENVDRYIKEKGVGCLMTIDDANDGQPQMRYQR